MGYAESSSAFSKGTEGRTVERAPPERYLGANINLRLLERRTAQDVTPYTAAIRDMLEHWTVASFERERAALDTSRARQTRRVADFVRALYDLDDANCGRMVASMTTEGPQELARTLFSPAAHLIGLDWCSDAADFLRVTMAMSRLQRLFHGACATLPAPAPRDKCRRILLAPAPGNQHGFGLSIVEDAFRRQGWHVDNPDDAGDALKFAASRHYRIIGISVSCDRHLTDLRDLAQALRARSRNPSVTLMAGGSAASRDPQALLSAGFDLVSADVATAVREADAIADARLSAPS